MIMIGCALSMSSENWIIFWVGMEISSLFFSAILTSFHSQGFLSWVIAWNYFIYQCLGSFVVLFSVLIDNEGSAAEPLILLAGVMLKLGLFPFQGWVIPVFENASFFTIFVLSTLQKIPPLLILSLYKSLFEGFEVWVISLSVLWVSLTCMVVISAKNILALSSILTASWMSVAVLYTWEEFVWFFLTYSFYLLLFLWSLGGGIFLDSGSISCLCSDPRGFVIGKQSSFALGCLMGMPPFGPFWAKVMVISSLISSNGYAVAFLMLLGSIMLLVGYFLVLNSLYFSKTGWTVWEKNPAWQIIFLASVFPLLGVL